MFQWIGTDYITYVDASSFYFSGSVYITHSYGFEFIGNQSVPVDPSSSTDYIPTLVPATNTTGPYVRLDYAPGGLPASTGLETGMILDLSDD